jgi:hypothetical protein
VNNLRWNLVLGIGCVVFALVTLLVWIPADIESGLIEQVRRQTTVGDALAPSLWIVGMGLLGLILALDSAWKLRQGEATRAGGGPSWSNLMYVAGLAATIFAALGMMSLAGPMVVTAAQWFGLEIDSYRNLRDTAPWKYIGYVAGGFVLIFALMSYIERRPTWRLALIAALAVICIALAYDLPFRGLLLPPNGDQ